MSGRSAYDADVAEVVQPNQCEVGPLYTARFEASWLTQAQFRMVNALLAAGVDLTEEDENGVLILREKVCFEYTRVYADDVAIHYQARTEPHQDLYTNGRLKVRWKAEKPRPHRGSSLISREDVLKFENTGEIEC